MLSVSASGEGPTWAVATAEACRKVIMDEESPTWEEVIRSSPQKKISKKEDSDWDEDTHIQVESQFEDAVVVMAETCMDTAEESTVELLPLENIVEASVGLGSQDMVQIHVGNDDID